MKFPSNLFSNIASFLTIIAFVTGVSNMASIASLFDDSTYVETENDDSSYIRQMKQLEEMGKKLEALSIEPEEQNKIPLSNTELQIQTLQNLITTP